MLHYFVNKVIIILFSWLNMLQSMGYGVHGLHGVIAVCHVVMDSRQGTDNVINHLQMTILIVLERTYKTEHVNLANVQVHITLDFLCLYNSHTFKSS